MPKYLLLFEKGESVRWLGHLDILRTFERAIRRASLPIAFSNGFNPRERIAFASALSVGITGGEERATLELTEPLQPSEIVERLNTALPPGIRMKQCDPLPEEGARDLLNSYSRAEYKVTCLCPEETTEAQIEAAIEKFLEQTEIVVEREKEGRVKSVNIRPGVTGLFLQTDSLAAGRVTLTMIIGMGEGTVRPGEVIATLAQTIPGLSLRRAHKYRLLTSGIRD